VKPTLSEKLLARLQNYRVIAGLVLIGTVVIALSTFTDATKNLFSLFGQQSPEEARLKLSSMGVAYTPEAFVDAAGAGDLVQVNLFLGAGMDANTIASQGYGPSALSIAAKENHLEVVDRLLKAGAKISANPPNNALIGGVLSGNVAVLNRLLKSTVTPSEVSEAFTMGGNRPILEALVAHGADVSKDGAAALLYSNDPDAVAYLLAHGADINSRDAQGRTLLERLDYDTMNVDTLETLAARGADLKSRDKNGEPLLHKFAARGVAGGVDVLLAHGVEVNAPDAKGRTALSLACELDGSSNPATIKLLLEKGADVNAPDLAGHTPLYYAKIHSRTGVVQLLEEHGAK
jgi:ankyrin repeat protein